MLEVVAEWWKTKEPIWERVVSGKHVKGRIDLILYKRNEIIRRVRKVKLLSSLCGLLVDMEGDNGIEPIQSVVVDWDRVDETVGKGERKEEVNEDWYWELKGETGFDKLLEFQQSYRG